MSTLIAKVTSDQGVTFNVVAVFEGDKYGRNNCLTNDEKDTLIEFHDARHDHDEFGQFVSRYYLRTLLNRESGDYSGLNLHGGVPSWSIDPLAMRVINRSLELL